MTAISRNELLSRLDAAVADKSLSSAAGLNIRRWITEPCYAEFAPELADHLIGGKWPELEAAFWTVIPFGTAGRRGPMYPIGTATINDRTIGESAQGLADYVRRTAGAAESLRCAVAYDTRHRSRHFAELCCEVMAAAGFTVFFLEDFRSTPELSFLVRHAKCHCGIMVSASHNPPQDNAVKMFGSNGGQFCPPADGELMKCVDSVSLIARKPSAEATRDRQIIGCQADTGPRYQAAVLANSFPGPRDIGIIYSPLHGVGQTSVLPVLLADGFTRVEVFAEQAEPNGDFPNVPGGIANPENPAIFSQLIARAQATGADLAIASDPDADRIGCAAPLSFDGEQWEVLNGNQIGVLLADYVLRKRQAAGSISPQHYIVTTLVTTEMIRRIGDFYGVRIIGDVLTGFKWISNAIEQNGEQKFVFGCEEAHGYTVGTYVRDKDAAAAAMLLAESAAELKAQGRTLHEHLESLFAIVGCHEEHSFSQSLPGAEGQTRIRHIMDALRRDPPEELAGMRVVAIRDYGLGVSKDRSGIEKALPGPRSDLLFFDLERPGNYIAIRPSGTEPKLKIYLFSYQLPRSIDDVRTVRAALNRQLLAMQAYMRMAIGESP